MRGQGRVYQRGDKWWVAYYVRGKEYRESAGATKAEAKRYLKKRLGEINSGRFVGPQEERITVNEILDNLIHYLETKGAPWCERAVHGVQLVSFIERDDRLLCGGIRPPRLNLAGVWAQKSPFTVITLQTGLVGKSFVLTGCQCNFGWSATPVS